MGIRFYCEHCEKRLNVKSFLAGKKGLCPHCGGRIRIPLESRVEATAKNQSAVKSGVGLGEDRADAEQESDADVEWSAIPNVDQLPQLPTVAAAEATAANGGVVWYVSPPGGGQYGPASRETVEEWIAEGRVTAETLVWCDGWDEWEVAARHFVQFQFEDAEPRAAPVIPDDESVAVGAGEAPVAAEAGPDTERTVRGYVLGESARGRKRQQRSWIWIAIFAFLAILLLSTLAIVLIL